MQPLLLINRETYEIAAELRYDDNDQDKQEVIIKEQWLIDNIKASGITVSRAFSKANKCNGKVYPCDDKIIFAKAFKEFQFRHGLMQMGYFWREKNEYDGLSDAELAKKIIELYHREMKEKSASKNIPENNS